VANRVAQIQENLECENFYHISGVENPSDCLSRGILPSQLIDHDLWWKGPSWMCSQPESWPIKPFVPSKVTELPEVCSKSLVSVVQEPSSIYALFNRKSSWTRLLRVMIFVLRFMRILPCTKNVEVSQLETAERYVLFVVQQQHFSTEYTSLCKGVAISKPLRKLDLFLDKDNLIRIGGRLENANLSFDAKHPILLPKSDHVVDLLVDHYHKRNCHTGASLLSSIIKQKYWILSSRNVIRKRIGKCLPCFRTKPKSNHPKMASLPAYRVQECNKAFVHTGVDYAGPINTTLVRRRGQRSQKSYICLFSCLTTRAVHVELVSSLSSDSFLDAFKRFLSRRGPVSCLYSDNGTNFVGAKAQLQEMYRLLESEAHRSAFNNELLANKIVWKMIPPNAPHFGGCWESQIKSLKSHLYRVIGTQLLTYEELMTVLIQIEAIMNCRPLCLMGEDHNPEILTPAHFLMTSPLQCLPAPDVSAGNPNLLSRKHLLDSMVQSFWKKWRLEYLHSMQSRQKWCTAEAPIQVGAVVLVHMDDVPPLRWPLGKVEEVFPGPDGTIRVALVRTKTGCLKRPVVKLCPLPRQ
jgi:hypothetical protein